MLSNVIDIQEDIRVYMKLLPLIIALLIFMDEIQESSCPFKCFQIESVSFPDQVQLNYQISLQSCTLHFLPSMMNKPWCG